MTNSTFPVAQKQNSHAMQSYFPSDADWRMMLDIGTKALKSGMLPQGIKTPEAAAIIALKARELGMPLMVGFAHIAVINGKPTLSAEMMQAVARKNLPGLSINLIESSNEKASVEITRPEPGSKAYTLTFTMDDAKKADLLKNNVWSKYPAAMLWSRAISAALRKICPDALMGVSYTPEELGADVDENGHVIHTTGKVVSTNGSECPQVTNQTQFVTKTQSNSQNAAIAQPDPNTVRPEAESQRHKMFQEIDRLVQTHHIPVSDLQAYVYEKFKVRDGNTLNNEQLAQVIAWLKTPVQAMTPEAVQEKAPWEEGL